VRDETESALDAWMMRLASGERDAFDPLFRALYPRAVRLARSRVGEAMAADVAQSTMTKLFSRASEFEPGRAVLPWFYAIAANEVRAASRSVRREARDDGAASDALIAEGDVERELMDEELTRALNGAIEALDAPSAEAIHALLGRGPAPAIAAAALRKRISRAYVRLRKLLLGELDAS
jgi:RNA polymerase sigma factor (sigma-70 family)